MINTGMTPYTVLGVSPTDSPDEIARAYRRLLRHHHPDTRAHGSGPADEVAHDEALRAALAAYALITSPSPGPGEPPAKKTKPVPCFEDPPVVIGTLSLAARTRPIWLITM
jgi:hypothetical protein